MKPIVVLAGDGLAYGREGFVILAFELEASLQDFDLERPAFVDPREDRATFAAHGCATPDGPICRGEAYGASDAKRKSSCSFSV
jgi:hypothetical protein